MLEYRPQQICKATTVRGWMELITYNMLKQFLWGHVKGHGINNLESQEKSFFWIHVNEGSIKTFLTLIKRIRIYF